MIKPSRLSTIFALLSEIPNGVPSIRRVILDQAFSRRLLKTDQQWHQKPLCEITTKIASGATPSGGRNAYHSKGVPLIRSMNVHFAGFNTDGLVFLDDDQARTLANVTVQEGDVLLNITGASIGRVTTAPVSMAGARVNQHVMIIRPIAELDGRFLSMYLASPKVQRLITDIQVGATREALTKGMVQKLQIPLPSLAEQRRIVAKVDELMGLCDRLEAQLAERETRQAGLVRASLAQFAADPTPAKLTYLFHPSYHIPPAELRKTILTLAVQGKLVPRTDDTNKWQHHRRVSSAIESVHPHAMAGEELFEIPATWKWTKVAEVATTRLGKMLDKHKNRGEHYPYLRNTNVHWFRFDLSSIKSMPFEKEELKAFEVQPGDVLICEGGHGIGRTAVWNGAISSIMFQKALHRVRPSKNLNGHFFAYCIRVYELAGLLGRYYTGAGIPHLTGKSLAKMDFPLPPIEEQNRIVAKTADLMALVDELEGRLTNSRATEIKLLESIVQGIFASS
jgi:type I restriction enzyme S subunit